MLTDLTREVIEFAITAQTEPVFTADSSIILAQIQESIEYVVDLLLQEYDSLAGVLFVRFLIDLMFEFRDRFVQESVLLIRCACILHIH